MLLDPTHSLESKRRGAGGGATTSFEGTTGPPATRFIAGDKIAITAKANALFMIVLLVRRGGECPR
jgi:hypothetical protein